MYINVHIKYKNISLLWKSKPMIQAYSPVVCLNFRTLDSLYAQATP